MGTEIALPEAQTHCLPVGGLSHRGPRGARGDTDLKSCNLSSKNNDVPISTT